MSARGVAKCDARDFAPSVGRQLFAADMPTSALGYIPKDGSQNDYCAFCLSRLFDPGISILKWMQVQQEPWRADFHQLVPIHQFIPIQQLLPIRTA